MDLATYLADAALRSTSELTIAFRYPGIPRPGAGGYPSHGFRDGWNDPGPIPFHSPPKLNGPERALCGRVPGIYDQARRPPRTEARPMRYCRSSTGNCYTARIGSGS